MMIEIFSLKYMQSALIAGILTGITCSLLSVYVTLKKMSFIGQGISHSAFGGIALGLWIGLDVNLTAIVFSLSVTVVINFFSQKSKIDEDSIIGMLLTFSMALGVLFLSFKEEYTTDVMSYLFGNILAVTSQDIVWLIINFVLVIGVILFFYYELLYFAFNERIAKLNGVPVNVVRYIFSFLLTITIVSVLKIVGIILISALLIVPGITARLLHKRFKLVLLFAVIIGTVTNIAGLILSYYLDIPSGATIVVVSFTIFVFVFTIKRLMPS